MVLTGSCPWPGPWSWSYGAHLHCRPVRIQEPTASTVPSAYLFELNSLCRSSVCLSADTPLRPLPLPGASRRMGEVDPSALWQVQMADSKAQLRKAARERRKTLASADFPAAL